VLIPVVVVVIVTVELPAEQGRSDAPLDFDNEDVDAERVFDDAIEEVGFLAISLLANTTLDISA
jgi:hypothetical protein